MAISIKITKGFKGKSRLRALWDITGYALQGGTWTNPPTVEMYLYQMATFWSMKAPTSPSYAPWNRRGWSPISTVRDTLHLLELEIYRGPECERESFLMRKRTKVGQPQTSIVPKAVSKVPVIYTSALGSGIGRLCSCICMVDSFKEMRQFQSSRSRRVGLRSGQHLRLLSQPPASKRTQSPKGWCS